MHIQHLRAHTTNTFINGTHGMPPRRARNEYVDTWCISAPRTPKCPQDAPKCPQGHPKEAPIQPKVSPRAFQSDPQTPRWAPRASPTTTMTTTTTATATTTTCEPHIHRHCPLDSPRGILACLAQPCPYASRKPGGLSRDFACHAANRRRCRRRRMRAIPLQSIPIDFSIHLANIVASVPVNI